MPIKIYQCPKCNKEKRKLFKNREQEKSVVQCEECLVEMVKKVAVVSDTIVREQADEYHNKQVKMGLSDIMKKRAKKHYAQYELPRLIEEYGLKHAKENNWLRPDGKPKKPEDFE